MVHGLLEHDSVANVHVAGEIALVGVAQFCVIKVEGIGIGLLCAQQPTYFRSAFTSPIPKDEFTGKRIK